MIKQVPWSNDVDRMFNAAGNYSGLSFVRDQVNSGIAQLWHGSEGVEDCYIITRVDKEPHIEWVCLGAVGTGVSHFARILMHEAKKRGIQMRLHVDMNFPHYKSLVRLWKKIGFREDELVMRAA